MGAQLRGQAIRATLYSLLGMLIYLWWRFELIYGVAAVVAVFHDTLITIGAFSLTNKELTLTVIAAILTLVGYSMNDTIVVFDRIRENLRMSRSEPLRGSGEPQHQPDAEPDGVDLGADVPDRALAVPVWRRGVAWFFVRAGGGHFDRDVLVDCGGCADAGGVAGVAGGAWTGGGAAGCKAGPASISGLAVPANAPAAGVQGFASFGRSCVVLWVNLIESNVPAFATFRIKAGLCAAPISVHSKLFEYFREQIAYCQVSIAKKSQAQFPPKT